MRERMRQRWERFKMWLAHKLIGPARGVYRLADVSAISHKWYATDLFIGKSGSLNDGTLFSRTTRKKLTRHTDAIGHLVSVLIQHEGK